MLSDTIKLLSIADIRLVQLYPEDLYDKTESAFLSFHSYEVDTVNDEILNASALVSALLQGLPMSPVFIDGSRDAWKFVSGGKNFYMLLGYIHHRFALHHSSISTDGVRFDQLPLAMQDKLLHLKVPVYVLNPGATNIARYMFYQYTLLPMSASKKSAILKLVFPKQYVLLCEKRDEVVHRYGLDPKKKHYKLEQTICDLILQESGKNHIALALESAELETWLNNLPYDKVNIANDDKIKLL